MQKSLSIKDKKEVITWYRLPDGRIGHFDKKDAFGRFKVGEEYVRLQFGEVPQKIPADKARGFMADVGKGVY